MFQVQSSSENESREKKESLEARNRKWQLFERFLSGKEQSWGME